MWRYTISEYFKRSSKLTIGTDCDLARDVARIGVVAALGIGNLLPSWESVRFPSRSKLERSGPLELRLRLRSRFESALLDVPDSCLNATYVFDVDAAGGRVALKAADAATAAKHEIGMCVDSSNRAIPPWPDNANPARVGRLSTRVAVVCLSYRVKGDALVEIEECIKSIEASVRRRCGGRTQSYIFEGRDLTSGDVSVPL